MLTDCATVRVGQNHIYIYIYIYIYILCNYGIFVREITVYTVVYGAYTRYFWQGNHQIYGHLR